MLVKRYHFKPVLIRIFSLDNCTGMREEPVNKYLYQRDLNQIYVNSIKFKLISDLKLEFTAICYYWMLINIWIDVLNLYTVVYFYNM